MGKKPCQSGKKRKKLKGKPRFECERCGHLAKKKDQVCKPKKRS